MYAQTEDTTRAPLSSAARPSRATLKTRPTIQRATIRSWEYIEPVRNGILIVRLLVVCWLVFLGAVLMRYGHGWGWTMLLAAAAMLAVSLWVYRTAAKGWPAATA